MPSIVGSRAGAHPVTAPPAPAPASSTPLFEPDASSLPGFAIPTIRIAVDRSKEFRVGSTCYLDFRVSGTGVWRRMHVSVRIVAGIGDRDEEHEFQLSLDEHETAATHSWRFIPRLPGEQRIRSLRVAVQNIDDLARVAFVRTQREALSFHVVPDRSEQASHITIQGSVYGSLVGHNSLRQTSAGYADALLQWADLPLVDDRDGSWWEGRKVNIAQVPTRAVMRWRSGGVQRSLFVVPGNCARIGRRKEDCDIVARWLPCRTQQLHPDNWERNRDISRLQLRIFATREGLAIEPAHDATSPTHLEVRESSERLTGRLPITSETRLRLGAPGGSPRAGLLLVVSPVMRDGRVAGALITRPENAPEHAYIVLADWCLLGRCGVGLEGLPEAVEVVPVGSGVALRRPAAQPIDRAALDFGELSSDDFTRYPS